VGEYHGGDAVADLQGEGVGEHHVEDAARVVAGDSDETISSTDGII
jgi:hypothetical protein